MGKPVLRLIFKSGIITISLIFLSLQFFVSSCTFSNTLEKQLLYPDSKNIANQLHQRKGRLLKVHIKNGDLFLFKKWKVFPSGDTLVGTGKHYSIDRKNVRTGEFIIYQENVALYELDQIDYNYKGTMLIILTLLTGAALFADDYNSVPNYDTLSNLYPNHGNVLIDRSKFLTPEVSGYHEGAFEGDLHNDQ